MDSRLTRTTGVTAALAIVLVGATAPAEIVLAPGYHSRIIATGQRPVTGMEYNPVSDTWLGIEATGWDYINEANRAGSIHPIADTFGLGGMWRDELAVAHNNLAWVAEPHYADIYQLVPATVGCVKRHIMQLGGWTRQPATEADYNGDLIVGFAEYDAIHAPADWYRITQAGSASLLFSTSDRAILWLERDKTTGTFYGIDVYSSSGPVYWDRERPRLVTIDTSSGAITDIRQYDGFQLDDIEADRTHDIVASDVLWAGQLVGTTYAIVPIDPITGDIGAAIATATDGWTISSPCVAPSSDDPMVMSLYAQVGLGTGEVHVIEIIPEPTTLALLALGGVALLRRRLRTATR